MNHSDHQPMARAIALAARGQGFVEPNPMVGCVLVKDGATVGEGWHKQFGGPHAEIEALRAAGECARGSTMFVTLEPCCHQGKTPPCTQAVLDAGVSRVVIALRDPFPKVDGGGIAQLEAAGVKITVGVMEAEARALCAPYLKLVTAGRPWMIAKWAMSLDGKIATHSGDSRWISGEGSRKVVHALRARVDAILIGRGTAEADDPLLTARLAKEQEVDKQQSVARIATRIVVDSAASLSLSSQLVRTAREVPVLLACAEEIESANRDQLLAAGVELFHCPGATHAERLSALLDELGRRRLTNVLIEGGSQLLGGLFDAGQIDEAHVFIAPKIIGGNAAPSPIAGQGTSHIAQAISLDSPVIQQIDADIYLSGRVAK